MTDQTLEQKLQREGGAVKMARNSSMGPYASRVPSEVSNWLDEQKAWRETAGLLDLTHHMTDLSIEGPDTIRLLSDLGVNSFANFQPNKAKQFVCCNAAGHVIGDGILFYLDKNKISLLGLPWIHNWTQYHAQSGRYDVTVQREEPTGLDTAERRKLYRFQVQGPKALEVLKQASSGTLPEIKFFNIGEFKIGGCKVRALRHGMSSAPGLELFGPWDDMEEIRAAIVAAGSQHGLREVGTRAYITTAIESGWIPAPVPAIFTGAELEAYRQRLPGNGIEGVSSLGGSFYSNDIADYYMTPYELGYGPFVKFDHDFIGRTALEAMGDNTRRRKVTLAWNVDDVLAAMRTLFECGDAAKYMELPFSGYAMWHYDRVLKNGNIVGLSTHPGYSYNERSMLSLGVLDADVAIRDEVTLIWGEEGGGSKRPVVERHAQIEIRATVSPCPYSKVARTSYAQGWRTRAVGA